MAENTNNRMSDQDPVNCFSSGLWLDNKTWTFTATWAMFPILLVAEDSKVIITEDNKVISLR